jgi:hypothetical protein
MNQQGSPAPDVLLLIAPGCAHCPIVLEGLSKLIKQGVIGRLEIVNVAKHPEIAREVGSRSVPWTRIGRFEFVGMLSHTDLARWSALATQEAGMAEYYEYLLDSGQLNRVMELVPRYPNSLHQLVSLLSKERLPMAARIGVGAVLEELQGSDLIDTIIPELTDLAYSPQPQTRIDACHYLGLTDSSDVIPTVQHLIKDDHPEVREIAIETLAMLKSG